MKWIVFCTFIDEKVSAIMGSVYVSLKLPTYPSPKPTLTLSSYLGQNVGLGRGTWAVSQKRKVISIM